MLRMYVVIPKSQAECNQLISVLHSKGFVCDNDFSWNGTVIKEYELSRSSSKDVWWADSYMSINQLERHLRGN